MTNAQDIEDIYELSPLQQGILFHTQYDSASQLYFEQVVVPFEASVLPRAFEDAWSCVIQANPVLRTSFHWEATDKPVQVVHRQATISFDFRDWRRLPPGRIESELNAYIASDREKGFDLRKAPLIRVTLLQAGAASHRMILSFHHIILDGWSLQIVLRQFTQAYQSRLQGRTPHLSATRPFSDYVRWLQRQDLKSADSFWRGKLGDIAETGRMVVRAPETNDPESYSESSFELSEERTKELKEFASRHRLTINTLVQAGWALLLHRLTGARHILFGVVVSGRPAELKDVESMVGLFINTLPLRTRVEPEAEVASWLTALQSEQSDARQYDYTPLVRVKEWCDGAKPGPLFDTLLAFENYPVQGGAQGSNQTKFIERTNYPLSAAVVPGQKLHTRLLYNREVFDEQTIRHYGEHFHFILSTLAGSAARRIGELETLAPLDRALLADVNDTAAEYPEQSSVNELWAEQVARCPGAIALDFPGRLLTYREVDEESSRKAASLRSGGLRRGDAVGILLPRSPEFVIGILAVLKAGSAYVPVDPEWPVARTAGMMESLGITWLISTPAMAADVLSAYPARLVDVSACDAMEPGTWKREEPARALETAYIMFTSGSTGEPKCIAITHQAILRLVRNSDYISLGPGDRIGHLSNCAFDASTFEIWGALLNGGCLVGISQDAALAPGELVAELRHRNVGSLFLTTALFNLVAAGQPDGFSTLNTLLFGGESVDARAVRAVVEAGPPKRLLHVYGPTETTTFATWHRIDGMGPRAENIPIGRPIANTTMYVLNADLAPMPAGAVGELYLGGPGVALGYQGKPRQTAERFLPDPYGGVPGARMYRTGDQVRWLASGAIEFLGRLDRQVKLRGFRIELSEIERRLLDHPRVHQAAVLVRSGRSLEKSIAAYVVLGESRGQESAAELRNALQQTLPGYMIPAWITTVDALPLNANGKIDLQALPDPQPAEQIDEQPSVLPQSETGIRLAAIWKQVLGVHRIGVHDTFFEVGGHSLLATQLVSRIRREFGVEIPLRAVFENSTVAEQAVLLEQQALSGAAPPAEIVRVSRLDRRKASA